MSPPLCEALGELPATCQILVAASSAYSIFDVGYAAVLHDNIPVTMKAVNFILVVICAKLKH